MTRTVLSVLAPVWLSLVFTTLASDSLFEMKRLGLRLAPEQQVLLLGHPEAQVEFQLFYDGDMNAATRLRAELQGPGITVPVAVDQAAADGLRIGLSRDLFQQEGTYRLTDVRLEQDGRVLAYAQPQQAKIEVVRDLVVTRVEVRELDMGELQQRGYLFSEDDFKSLVFNMSLVMGAKQVEVDVPVLIPKKKSRMLRPQIIRDPFQPYVHFMWVPDALGNGTGAAPYAETEYPAPDSDRYDVLSLLAVPGNFNYLKSHFSVTSIVLNTAPDGYQVQLRNLKARIGLPDAGRYGVPLRIAQQTGSADVEKPMIAAGADGLAGTGDDVAFIEPGDEAAAEFLLIGEVEGMYDVEVAVSGEADLPQGVTPISAKASGLVYVRSPEFSVTYEHPDTVAADESYDFYMHFTNRGTVPLEGLSVELDPFKLIGTQMQEGWNPIQTLPSIPAGGEGSVHYRFVSRVTGTVVASYYKLENGTPGNLALGVGVAETGERLSPFVLHFPSAFETAFGAPLAGELKRLGKKLLDFSQTADSELPEGVLPVSPTVVKAFNTGMAAAARNLELGLSEQQSHAQLLSWFMRGGEDHVAVDHLRRRFTAQGALDLEGRWGSRLAQVFAGMDDASLLHFLAQENEATPGLFLAVVDGNRPFAWQLSDAAGRSLSNPSQHRNLPFSAAFPLGGQRTLIMAAGGETTPRLSLQRLQGDHEPLAVRAHVVLPQGRDGGQYAVDCGSITLGEDPVRLGFDHEQGLVQIHQNQTLRERNGGLVSKKPFALLSISQLDRLTWPQADDFGRDVLLTFSKEVDLTALDPIEEHLFFNGQPAVSAIAQSDGRFLVVGAQQPLGPYHDITYEIRGARSVDGLSLPTLRGTFRGSNFYTGTGVGGKVVDRNGSDLDEARVFLWVRDIVNYPDIAVYRIVDEAKLDGEGRYGFDFVPYYPFGGGSQSLLKQFRIGVLLADGRYDTRDFSIQGVGGDIAADFAFLQRGSVWGRVVDDTGQPVAQAHVYAAAQHNPDRSAAQTHTDQNGYYRLDGLEVGQIIVKVGALNGLIAVHSAYLTEQTSPLRVDLQLNQPTGTLTGTVTAADENGTSPLAGAVVGWVLEGQTYSMVRLGAFNYPVNELTQADASGRFRLEQVPAGTGVLFAWHPDAVYRYQKINLPAGGETNIDFHYDQAGRAGGTVAGVVQDVHGFPIGGALVTTTGGFSFVTGNDGHFQFERVPFGFGITLLGSRAGSDLKGSATVSLDPQNPVADNVVLVLRDPVLVQGRYLDVEGQPIPFDNIYNPYNDGRKPRVFATTDANGYWQGSLADYSGHPLSEPGEGIQTGMNFFTGSMPPSIAMAEVFVGLEGLDGVIVQQQPLSQFQVSLTDGLGNPVVGTVEVSGLSPSISIDSMGIPREQLLYRQVTDGEGRRLFGQIPVGQVTVKGLHPQLGETEALTFELQPPGESIQDIALAFAQDDPANLFGRVFDVDGESPAPAGTLVTAQIGGSGLTATVAVNPEGFYHFEDLVNTSDPTLVKLAAYHPESRHFGTANLQLHQDLHFRHDMLLHRKGNVHIGVQHADGSPAAYALVQIRYQAMDFHHEDGSNTHFNLRWAEHEFQITPDQPIASFTELPVSQFTVKALGPNGLIGMRRYSLPLAGGDLNMKVQLEAASSISGTFIDHGDQPIADAEVQLRNHNAVLHQKVTGNEGEERGRFAFADLPMRTYRLKGIDPRTAFESHMEVTTSPFLPNPDVVLRLDPLAHLQGVVTQDGQPLAGASVRLENRDFHLITGTDANGVYRFENLPLGEYQITSKTPSTPARAAAGVSLTSADETVFLDLRYEPVYEALVKVRYADDTPAANVRLLVNGTDNHLQQIVFTNAEGEARLFDLIKGRYYTYAENAELGLELRDGFTISEASVSPLEQTVFFPGWGSIGGQVRDTLGNRLAHPVSVTFTWGWGDLGVKRWTITTDSEGHFYKSGVPLNERIRVSVTDPETFVSGEYEIMLDHTGQHHEQDLVLRATTHATGRVTYADGTPASFAEVWVETPTLIKLQTDENGDFQFRPLVQGEVTLFAKDRYSPRRTAQTLNIQPTESGSLNPLFNLSLALGGIANLSGNVSLSDGTPVRAGQVRLEVEELDAVFTATIMAGGGYFFTNVPQGTYHLRAYDANLSETSPRFTVDPPEDGASLTQDLQFQPSYTLAGRVVRGDFSGVADALVELWRRDPDTTRYNLIYSAVADAEGQYHINHVYPGAYRIVAKDPLADLVAQFEFDQTSGDRLDFDVLLQPQSTLLGRLVDAETVPYSSGRVTLYDSAGTPLGVQSLDGNGAFRYNNLVPGNYRLAVYAEAGWVQEEHHLTLVAGLNNLPITTGPTVEVVGRAIFQILPAKQPSLFLVKDDAWRSIRLNADGTFHVAHVPRGARLAGVLKHGPLKREWDFGEVQADTDLGTLYLDGIAPQLQAPAAVTITNLPHPLQFPLLEEETDSAVDPQRTRVWWNDQDISDQFVTTADQVSSALDVLPDSARMGENRLVLQVGNTAGATAVTEITVQVQLTGAVLVMRPMVGGQTYAGVVSLNGGDPIATDALGRAIFYNVPPGDHTLKVRGGLLGARQRVLTDLSRPAYNLNLELGQHGGYHGSVIGADGLPAAGAVVAVGGERETTGADGVYLFDLLPLGYHHIFVESDDAVGHLDAGRLRVNGAIVDQTDIQLVAEGTLQGVVYDHEGGQAVPGAEVVLSFPGQPDFYRRTTVTDAAGLYQFGRTPSWPFLLEGYEPVSKRRGILEGRIESAGQVLARDLYLEPAADVSGVLQRVDGGPAAAVSLRVFDENHSYAEAVTAADGSFTLADVPHGVFQLEGDHLPGREFIAREISVAGSALDLGTLTMVVDQPPVIESVVFPDPLDPLLDRRFALQVRDDRELSRFHLALSGDYALTFESPLSGEVIDEAFVHRLPVYTVPDGSVLNYVLTATDHRGQTDVAEGSFTVQRDLQGPNLAVQAPAADTAFDEGQPLEFTVSADDLSGIDRIELSHAGTRYDTADKAPFVLRMTAPPVDESQPVTFQLTAFDQRGNATTVTHSLTIRAVTTTGAPTLVLQTPMEGIPLPLSLAEGLNIQVRAAAADPDGLQSCVLTLDGLEVYREPLNSTTADLAFAVVVPEALRTQDSLTIALTVSDLGGNEITQSVSVQSITGTVWTAATPLNATRFDLSLDGTTPILAGGVHTIDGVHAYQQLILVNGAVLTQTETGGNPNDVAYTELQVSGPLVVDAGSYINVDGKGYGGRPFEYPAATSGSYGGLARDADDANHSYGSVVSPSMPGSALGGGAVKCVAADLWLAGTVTAGGNNANNGSSGGSIQLSAATINGYGTVRANGYVGAFEPGAALRGGGGRLAVFGDPGNLVLQAFGGDGAGAGTIYLRQPDAAYDDGFRDTLRVAQIPEAGPAGKTPLPELRLVAGTDFEVFHNEQIDGAFVDRIAVNRFMPPGRYAGYSLVRGDDAGTRFPISRSTASALISTPNHAFPDFADGEVVHVRFDFDHIEVASETELHLTGHRVPGPIQLTEATLSSGENEIDLDGFAVLRSGANRLVGRFYGRNFTVPAGDTLYLNGTLRGTTLTVAEGGHLSAPPQERGAWMRLEADQVQVQGVLAATSNGLDIGYPAGNHGGLSPLHHNDRRSYGSLYEARSFGGANTAAAGGGRIELAARAIHVDGLVDVGSAHAYGSGGSIRLEGETLSGEGTIRANGVFGVPNHSHSSGGGRIAVLVNQIDAFHGAITAYGYDVADDNAQGGAGTIFFRTDQWPLGKLLVDNGGHPAPADSTPLPGLGNRTAAQATGVDRIAGVGFPGHNSLAGLHVVVGDQDPVAIAANSADQLTPAGSFPTVAAGESYSGLHILDVLEVRGGAALYAPDPFLIHGKVIVSDGTLNAQTELVNPVTVQRLSDGSGELFSDDGSQVYELDNYHLTVHFPLDVTRLDLRNGSSLTYTQPVQAQTVTVAGSHLIAGVDGAGPHFVAETVALTEVSTWTTADRRADASAYPLYAAVSGTLTLDATSEITTTGADRVAHTAPLWAGEALVTMSHGGLGAPDRASQPFLSYIEGQAVGSAVYPQWPGAVRGGGAVRLEAQTMLFDGTIRADGVGAGCGGSIWLTADQINGAGTLSAQAGSDSRFGAGRIAVHYGADRAFIDRLTVLLDNPNPNAQNVAYWGGSGTLFLKGAAQEHGELIVTQRDLAGTNLRERLAHRPALTGIASPGRRTLVLADDDPDPLVIRDATWTDLPPGLAGLTLRFDVAGTAYDARIRDNSHGSLVLETPAEGSLPALVPAGTQLEFVLKLDRLALNNGAMIRFDGVLEVGDLQWAAGEAISSIAAVDVRGLGDELVLTQQKVRLILDDPSFENRNLRLIDSTLYLDKPMQVGDITLSNSHLSHSPILQINSRSYVPWLHLDAGRVTMDADSSFNGSGGESYWIPHDQVGQRNHGGLNDSASGAVYGSLFYPDMPGSGNRVGGRVYLRADRLEGGSLLADAESGAAGSLWLDVDTLVGDIHLSAARAGNASFTGGGRIALHYGDRSAANLSFDSRGFHSSGTVFLKPKADGLGRLVIDHGGPADENTVTPLPAFPAFTLTADAEVFVDTEAGETLLTVPGLDVGPWFRGYEFLVNGSRDNGRLILASNNLGDQTHFRLEGTEPIAVGDHLQLAVRLAELDLCEGCRLDTTDVVLLYDNQFESGYRFENGERTFPTAPEVADGHLRLDNFQMTVHGPVDYDQVTLSNGATLVLRDPAARHRMGELSIEDGTLRVAGRADQAQPSLVVDCATVTNGLLEVDHLEAAVSVEIGAGGNLTGFNQVAEGLSWGGSVLDRTNTEQSFGGLGQPITYARYQWSPTYGNFKQPFAVGYLRRHLKLQTPSLHVDGRLAPSLAEHHGRAGALWIETQTLSGQGAIEANGGLHEGRMSSGGRIALYYTNKDQWQGRLEAFGGEHNTNYRFAGTSGSGTIFLKRPDQSHGDLLIRGYGQPTTHGAVPMVALGRHVLGAGVSVDGATLHDPAANFPFSLAGLFLRVPDPSGFREVEILANTPTSITVAEALPSLTAGDELSAVLHVDHLHIEGYAQFRTEDHLVVHEGLTFGDQPDQPSTLWARRLTLPFSEWTLVNQHGGLVVDESHNLTRINLDASTLLLDQPFALEQLHLSNGSQLSHSRLLSLFYSPYNRLAGIDLRLDTLTMDETSKIDVRGKGYAQGPEDYLDLIGLNGFDFGRGHGGVAGTGGSGYPYGSAFHPQTPGFRGGAGRIHLNAGTLEMDGDIDASGLMGGSIWLEVGLVRGSGRLLADGSELDGIAASGGRIAVHYDQYQLDRLPTAASPLRNGGQYGAGTVYMRDRASVDGELFLVNEVEPHTTLYQTPIWGIGSHTLSAPLADPQVITLPGADWRIGLEGLQLIDAGTDAVYTVVAAEPERLVLDRPISPAPAAGWSFHGRAPISTLYQQAAQVTLEYPAEGDFQVVEGLDVAPPEIVDVRFTPAFNQTVTSGQHFEITVVATDNVAVTKVALTVDGTNYEQTGAGPFVFPLQAPETTEVRSLDVLVQVYDARNNRASLAPTVSVVPADQTQPQIVVEAPLTGAEIDGGVPFETRIRFDDNRALSEVRTTFAGETRVTPLHPPAPGFTETQSWQAPVLFGDQAVTVTVTAIDLAGNRSDAEHSVMVRDVTAPGDPQNLVVARGETRLDLSWTAPAEVADDMAGYRLYVDAGVPVELPPSALQVPLTQLEPGTAYQLRLAAVDASGNESPGLSQEALTTGHVDTALPQPSAWWSFDHTPVTGPVWQFDGGSGHVDIADAAGIGRRAGALTLAAWVKVPADAVKHTYGVMSLADTNLSDLHALLRVYQGRAELVGQRLDNLSYRSVRGGPILRDDRWHRLVGVLDFANDLAVLYVDGEEVGRRQPLHNNPGLFQDSDLRYMQLGRVGHYNQVFDGMLWQTRLDRAAWTPEQVLRDYRDPHGLSVDGPAGLWLKDDVTPGQVIDSSGNGFHGENNGVSQTLEALPVTGIAADGGDRILVNQGGRLTAADGLGSVLQLQESEGASIEVPDLSGPFDQLTFQFQLRLDQLPSATGAVMSVLDLSQGGPRLQVNTADQVSLDLGGVSLVDPVSLSSGRWVHIAVTADVAGSIRLYVDGTKVAEAAAVGAVGAAGGVWTLGYGDHGAGLVGAVDNLAFWGETLTSAQVAQLAGNTLETLLDDSQAPGDPRAVSWQSTADQVVLDWDAPQGETPTAFHLFVDGNDPVVLGGDRRSHTLSGLGAGRQVALRLASVDAAGNQSEGVAFRAKTRLTQLQVAELPAPIAHWDLDEPDNQPSSLYFDGSAVVDLGAAAQIRRSASALTLAASIKLPADTNLNRNTRAVISLANHSSSDYHAALFIHNGQAEVRGQRLDSLSSRYIRAGADLRDGRWHRLVGVIDYAQDRLALYIDGHLVGERVPFHGSSGLAEDVASQSVLLGNYGVYNQHLTGQIYNLQIWRAAWNADQAAYDHENPHGLVTDHAVGAGLDRFSQLAGWWKGNEGDGSQINDHSGNGLHGSATNTRWIADADPLGSVRDRVGSRHGSNHNAALVNGLLGQALFFDRLKSAEVVVPHQGGADLGDAATLGFWFRLEDLSLLATQEMQLLGKSDDSHGFQLILDRDRHLVCRLQDGRRLVSRMSLQAGSWHHAALSWRQGEQLRLFFDGVETDALDMTGSMTLPETAWLWAINPFGGQQLNGFLDQISLWRHALNPMEIAALVLEEPIAGLDGLVADTRAPGDIRGLGWQTATDRLDFTWSPPEPGTGTVAGYDVFFNGSAQPQTLSADTTWFSATALAPGQTYAIRIEAFDAAGNCSGGVTALAATASDSVTVTTEETPLAHWPMDFPDATDRKAVWNGSNTQVDIDAASNLIQDVAGLTLSAWVRVDPATAANGSRAVVSARNTSDTYAYLQLNHGRPELVGQRLASDPTRSVRSSRDIRDGRWHHLVAVFDYSNNRVALYVDGRLDKENTAFQSSGGGSGDAAAVVNLQIGKADNWSRYFAGTIWNVQIWQAAFNADHVLYAYHYPLKPAGDDPAQSSLVTADHLYGWWQLGHEGTTIDDHSGNNRPGTATNLVWETQSDPVAAVPELQQGRDGFGSDAVLSDDSHSGHSLRFAAQSAYVRVPEDPAFFSDAWTWSVWVKPARLPTQTGTEQTLISNLSESGGMAVILSENNRLALLQNGLRTESGTQMVADVWQHVAVSFADGTARFYRNGVLTGEAAVAQTATPGGDWIFAALNTRWQRVFSGLLDEPTLWSSALNADQVRALFQAPVGKAEAVYPADAEDRITAAQTPAPVFQPEITEIRGQELTLEGFESEGDLWLVGSHVAVKGLIKARAIYLRDGSTLTHPKLAFGEEGGLQLIATEKIEIDAGSRIDLDGKGWSDPEDRLQASHAGLAGDEPGANRYGSPVWPTRAGRGEHGGGVAFILAPELILDGEIRARGRGYSSGGSVLVKINEISGRGLIDVSCGQKQEAFGGGGRVALHAERRHRFSGRLDAGTVNPGSVLLADAAGERLQVLRSRTRPDLLSLLPRYSIDSDQLLKTYRDPRGSVLVVSAERALWELRGLWLQRGTERVRIREVVHVAPDHWYLHCEGVLPESEAVLQPVILLQQEPFRQPNAMEQIPVIFSGEQR